MKKKDKQENRLEDMQEELNKTNKSLALVDKELKKIFKEGDKLTGGCRIMYIDAIIRAIIQHSGLNLLTAMGLLDKVKLSVSTAMDQMYSVPKEPPSYAG